MKPIIIAVLSLSIFCLVQGKVDKSKWLKLECKDGSYAPPNDLSSCQTPKGGNGFENCPLYCIADSMGKIDDNGRIQFAICSEWIDATFPDQYKDMAKTYIGDCFKNFGDKIDYSDSGCSMANQMMDCAMGGFPLLKC